METDNSEEKKNSPSTKKLKQARLPFKIISDTTALAESPVSRKRKLSTQEDKPINKIGRLSKDNETETPDLVVISDDENKDDVPKSGEKSVNPLLKIVDNARKKKMSKTKGYCKRKKGDKNTRTSLSTETAEDGHDKNNCTSIVRDNDIEKMDVDEQLPPESKTETEIASSESKPLTLQGDEKVMETVNSISDNKLQRANSIDVIILDDNTNPLPETEIKHVSSTQEDSNNAPNLVKPPSTTQLTPKRLTRSGTAIVNKEKSLDLNKSTSSSKLDESTSSNLSTPKQSKLNTSMSSSQESTNLNESNTSLTPKQLQRKLEFAKKREEREKEKLDREKKRNEEKEERVRAKQEKEDQKKKEREEKDEQRRKEKEEKEKQKELEKKLREEKEEQKRKEREEKEEQKRKEKEEKEEQRRKEKEVREEEKRKKQEALEQEKQEQELKKKRTAKAFVNFFIPKQKVEREVTSSGPVSQNDVLSSFTIKVDMRLAPTTRCYLSSEKKSELDGLMKEQNANSLYLKCLKEGVVQTGCYSKTWPLEDKDEDDEIMIVEDELPPLEGVSELISCEAAAIREKLKPKLFSFHDNRRPPYWGTWRKKSTHVKPRRPLSQDEKQVDYSVDSDEEWEDEDGESIDGSRAGSDEEPADGDEYEVDNEFFVPHGYLSDEEATMDEDDVLSLSPDAQKAKLKHLEEEFEIEMKKPTEKLKPRLYGILWETKDGGKPENCVDALWSYFQKLSMLMDDTAPLLQPSQTPQEVEKKKVRRKKTKGDGEHDSPKTENEKKLKSEKKDNKTPKVEKKKEQTKLKKNQPDINSFLKKLKPT